MKKFAFSALCAFFIFNTSATHSAPLCAEKIAEFRRHFQSLDFSKGLGQRGYLGFAPALSPEARIAAFAEGVNYWNSRFLVAKDLEAARVRDQLEPNPLIKAAFVLGQGYDDLPGLMNGGVHWFEDGKDHFIPGDEAKIIYDLPTMGRTEFEEFQGAPEQGFFQRGWYFTKIRGVMDYADILKSSTYKNKIRRMCRRYLRNGFTVTFNKAFDAALEAIANQKRKDGGTTRYNAAYKNLLKKLFESNYAYSVEVWNPEGKLVAGNVGLRFENLFKGDSVFYDVNDDGTSLHELAQMGVTALLDRLHDSGIDMMDAGMVSNFTAHLKGKYIPGPEFLVRMRELQKVPRNVDFSAPWTWIEEINSRGER